MTSLLRLPRAVALALLFSAGAHATGVLPETSVVIVEQEDGEGTLTVKNTDPNPVLLLTTLENIPDDPEKLLTVTPPAARVEPGKSQRLRFILISKTPLKTERLERVSVEGLPPQKKDKSEVLMTIRQNLPVLIRPAGLARDQAPWKRLSWKMSGGSLNVSNDSPYVVRLAQSVTTLPDNTQWLLPNTYVLPGQHLTLKADGANKAQNPTNVRLSPATTWGFSVNNYDAPLAR